jgi:glucose/arabinose dehydrogenase
MVFISLIKKLIPYALGGLVIGALLVLTVLAIQAPSIRVVRVAEGLEAPLGIVSPRDGTGRLFVVEKPGRIRIIQDGNLLPDPFIDLRDQINDPVEAGLLGLAFSPDYETDGLFYLNYTDLGDDTVVSQFRVSDEDPNRADPDSEQVLLWVRQPATNHNGGNLVFGPDGMLWIGLGDGGGGTRTDKYSQDPTELLGKMLRIDVRNLNGDEDNLPYDIPPDNPFVTYPEMRPEIWGLGLRNPWRYSFDAMTGDLYVGDVGESTWEEIDYVASPLPPGGVNFGWNIMEALHCNPLEYAADAECERDGLLLPVLEYEHIEGNLAVTGGFVYRGSLMPDLMGKYIFADFGSGRIRVTSAADEWQQTLLLDTALRIASFGEDEDGELYIAAISEGEVYRIARRTLWERFNPWLGTGE